MAERWASPDTATTVRILFRIVAAGVLLSTIVSTLTGSATAALTMGGFTGMVAGFATQTVLGNAVAGLFLGVLRPISIGDNITVSGNSGTVVAITLMHTVLRTDEHDVLVPSSNVAHAVIIRQREPEPTD
jgi:small-conductance mechanosensitive channel